MYKKLFCPGPTNVLEDVLQKMATPLISHRSKEASTLQRGISDKLRKLMYTQNEILLSTSSGSGLMEGAVRSCTQKKAAVFSCCLLFGANAFDLIYSRVYAIITNYGFMAVPLFVFMGNMLEKSDIAEKMYDAIHVWFGKFRGGLAITSVLIGTIMAAFMPGFLLSGLYMLYIGIRSYLQPSIAPSFEDEGKKLTFCQKSKRLITTMAPTTLLILSVMGAIYLGLASPTEAAAVGAAVATLLIIAYGRFSWKGLKDVTLGIIKLTGMVLLIAGCSTAFVSVFLSAGGGDVVENFILSIPGGRWMAFALIMFVCFILGMFIDWIGYYLCYGFHISSYCSSVGI